MKHLVVVLALMLGMTACEGSGDEVADVSRQSSPAPSVSVAAPTRFIASAERGCAPNDALAVVGNLAQHVEGGSLDITGPDGEPLGNSEAPAPDEGFVVRLRSWGNGEVPAEAVLRLRDSDGHVLEQRAVSLQPTEAFSLCG